MQIHRCDNGHLFDCDKYKRCPHCDSILDFQISFTSDFKVYEPIFGHWTIKNLIGEGGFGKVYEIEKIDLGITYKSALKAISIPQSQVELNSILSNGVDDTHLKEYLWKQVEDIVSECILMSKLKGNSNIVSYEEHNVIEHVNGIGWDILIRMELLTTINDYIRKNGFTQKDVIILGINICKALELCELHNIIHRDIKCENIFVSDNGEFKLGDFGIAFQINADRLDMSKKGTYSYIAPEVYSSKSYNAQVDIYSLGIVLYKLLNNNRIPFLPSYPNTIQYKDREQAIIKRMRGDKLSLPAEAEKKLAGVVLKACSYNVNDRYLSPKQMREDLERLLSKISKTELDKILMIYPKEELIAPHDSYDVTVATCIEKHSFDKSIKDDVNTSHDMEALLDLDINNRDADDVESKEKIEFLKESEEKKEKLSKRIFSKLIEWVLYTCVFSMLPLIVFALLNSFFKLESKDNSIYLSELLFFGITISVITIKDMVSLKMWKKEQNIFNIALFYSIFVLIISSILYGIIVLNGLTPSDMVVIKDGLLPCTIFIAVSSFAAGTAVQIWEVA